MPGVRDGDRVRDVERDGVHVAKERCEHAAVRHDHDRLAVVGPRDGIHCRYHALVELAPALAARDRSRDRRCGCGRRRPDRAESTSSYVIPSPTPKWRSRSLASRTIGLPQRSAIARAVSAARPRSLDTRTSNGCAARRAAIARACARPSAVRLLSPCPWIRASTFHSVCPWRTTMNRVIAWASSHSACGLPASRPCPSPSRAARAGLRSAPACLPSAPCASPSRHRRPHPARTA